MWDLAPMKVFINHPLYMGYSSPQYETGVLQELTGLKQWHIGDLL
jgi:hypothetical protein